jgi:hypothetical protein
MKKLTITLGTILIALTLQAQDVKINSKKIESFNYLEVYSGVKMMTTKEAVFVDTGDNNFKPVNWDLTKNQSVWFDGKRLKPKDSIKLKKYLLSNGWKIADKSPSSIGNIKITITTYTK